MFVSIIRPSLRIADLSSVSRALSSLSPVSSTRVTDGLSGAAAAGLALGVSELAAGFFSGFPSLVQGLGNFVIDVVPKPIEEWAISLFGTNDKRALLVGIALTTLLVGALVGILARDRFGIAIAAFVGFGVIAALAAARDPAVSLAVAIIPGGLAALSGLASLQWLYGLSPEPSPPPEGEPETEHGVSRRSLMIGLGAVLGVAALSAGLGRTLLENAKRAAAGISEVVLPAAADPASPVPAAAELNVTGLSTAVTSNEEFYRIDTAFSVPRVDIQSWTLKITGMVDRPYEVSYFDLLDMRMVERYVTLSCVSNQVGGDLIGNAKWLGVPLSEILDRAGVQEGADQLVGISVDGFTVGFPTEAAYDGREALVAVGMNDEPLPIEHGFPVRLVIAGLYGYVSATKWLSEINLTGWDDFDGYWIPRGWAKEAPIKTQSRIDTPTNRDRLSPGEVVVAGVAWAPTRGISKVEVELGENAGWVEAELSEALSENSWVQWKAPWIAEPGIQRLRVRATDGDGYTQTEEVVPPAPDGATGWHTRNVSVADA